MLKVAPGDKLGIHAHDDTGQAVANTLAAVNAGVRQIQGTLNGIGERCGNANLVTLIPTLLLKPASPIASRPASAPSSWRELTRDLARPSTICSTAPRPRQAPYVGASAFATKAGIHASALAKDSSTYEHVPPESVGNERNIMVSQQAGKSNLLTALKRHGIVIGKDDPRLERLLRTVKEREARRLFLRRRRCELRRPGPRGCSARCRTFFEVESYRASVERRHNARGEQITVTEAVVKIDIDGERLMSVAEGNGPVNALDLAMRKDLGQVLGRRSPISNWSTSRCVSSTAARARSPVYWSKAAMARASAGTPSG